MKINLLLYATLLILPFYKSTFTIEVGVATLDPYMIGIILLALMGLFINIFSKKTFGFNVLDLFILLFCVTYLCSILLSENILSSGYLAVHSIFIPVISYFVLKSFLISDSIYKRSLFFILAGIFLFSVIGLAYIGFTGTREMILNIPPIGVATFAVFSICNLVYSGWWKNKFGIVSLALALLLLFFSFSRVYLLGILGSPILYLFVKRGHVVKLFTFIFPFTLILTLLLVVNYDYFKPTKFEASKEKTVERVLNIESWKKALYARAHTYQEGIKNFKKKPFFGTGLYRGEKVITVHNFHIEWLEFGGILGYIICTGIFFVYFTLQKVVVKKDKFSTLNLCILIIILSNSVTNGIMHGLMPYFVFITMGFGEARRKLVETKIAKKMCLEGS